ncbi:MAG: hypothetical protein HYY59_06850 [Candidatus Omnitrophica bacterium]|nr:hypothetical protein [Candidatus Omnitrophota bacterium]
MRKRWIVAIGLAVASLFVIGSLASAMGKKPPMVSKASGKVTVVNMKDSKHPTVTVKPTQGQAVTLQIDPKKTLIMKNDKVIPASSIRMGDLLRADYEVRRGNNVAKRVFVEMPKAVQPAAKPSATQTKKRARR